MSAKDRRRSRQRAIILSGSAVLFGVVARPAGAQSTQGSSEVNLGTVPVTTGVTNSDGSTPKSGGFAVPRQSFGPFGPVPTLDLPFSTNSFPQELIRDTQARDIGELGRNDPSFGNYALTNASGYADFFIRGFQADNPTNFRIDGLPLTSQSGIVLDDYERVDLYKGLYGAVSLMRTRLSTMHAGL